MPNNRKQMQEITGFPGYFVTEDGRVFSYWNRRGTLDYGRNARELKQRAVNGNYLQVCLYGEKRKLKLVHRLVAETYLPNPDNLPQVNHKDEVKDNNHINNLEWCDNQYNCEYSHAKAHKIKTPTGETVEVFNIRKFCRENNLHSGAL